MANLSGVARPYALAAFKHAKEKQSLADWKVFLQSAAVVAQHKEVATVLQNPGVANEQLFGLFQDVLKTMLDSEKSNYLMLLAQNKRLNVLPAIYEFFNNLYASFEKLSNVKLTTAIKTEEAFQQKISDTLAKRIQRKITLECHVDADIIGGALIQIGDRVIDGSVRGKLQRLAENLLS